MSPQFTFQDLFDGVAPLYEDRIIRAFAPMAASLIEWVEADEQDTVLDIGTGTGIAARLIASDTQSVVGLDFSYGMLEEANRMAALNEHANLIFLQGDAHQLPFEEDSFSLVIGSFGFNATNPRQSLPEIHRVLMRGGRIAFQEWGGQHEFDKILIDTLYDYAIDDEDASDEVIALRDFFAIERPWYRDLQNPEDFVIDLEEYGFSSVEAHEYQPVQVQLTLDEFIRYKTAWTPPRIELNAMDSYARGDCLDTLRERLRPFVDGNNILIYDPKIIRVNAIK